MVKSAAAGLLRYRVRELLHLRVVAVQQLLPRGQNTLDGSFVISQRALRRHIERHAEDDPANHRDERHPRDLVERSDDAVWLTISHDYFPRLAVRRPSGV